MSKQSQYRGKNQGSNARKTPNNQVLNQRKQSSVNPDLLSRKASEPVVNLVYEPTRSFDEMPLHRNLLQNISKKGFAQPTEIQDRTLESLLDRRDLLGIAQTGTGKTGAFLIPVIDRLIKNKGSFQTLVLVPTRELALQVEEEYRSLVKGLGLHISCFIGGTNINRDLQNLRRHSHLVVATPGRLLDLYQRRALRLDDFEVLVLDEFDRMLDMGFARDVDRIVGAMSQRKHTMLFSATLDESQRDRINKLLRNPIEVQVSNGQQTGQHIDQEIIKLRPDEDKFARLKLLLDDPEFSKVLVFAETKRWVSKVNKKLRQSGITSDEIHGNKSQNYRQNALRSFRNGQVRVLVATDVAARGLDVSDVSHVINYQLPGSMDSYIHRIGRTGRAGNKGKALTFVQ